MATDFHQSQQWLKRALKTIPLASQTFSKSMISTPSGVSPHFAAKASGCYLTDIDGNEYIDFISALLCISLGYADQDVNQAVKEQLALGSIYSLPHQLETLVAEKLCELIPCAEQVRFGKNGTDATSAAIRLARAYTQREHVAVCGYHGWQDWYIGSTTRSLGVPESTRSLTHTFIYNDIDSLKKIIADHPEQIAAVILEPMNVHYPVDNFLLQVRQLCDEHHIVLIFDETITGFRFDLGGAQKVFGITPDLATFGKGMANGFPLSAIVGKRKIMQLMEDIFFSGTFGGDAIALAAAYATINKMEREPVLPHIHQIGSSLQQQLSALIEQHQLSDYFDVAGHPSWSFLAVKNGKNHGLWTIKTYLMQQLIQAGFLSNGSHNLSYAHQQHHIDALIKFYQQELPKIAWLDKTNTLNDSLNCPVMQPVFKVR